jgi:hypothetical protein
MTEEAALKPEAHPGTAHHGRKSTTKSRRHSQLDKIDLISDVEMKQSMRDTKQTLWGRLIYRNDEFIATLSGQIILLRVYGMIMNFVMGPVNSYSNEMNTTEALWVSFMCIMDPKFTEDAWLAEREISFIWVRRISTDMMHLLSRIVVHHVCARYILVC